MEFNKISAYILAGGQSSRMGYDKLLTKVGDISLIEKSVAACLPVAKSVKIAAKEKEKFSFLKQDVILDSLLADGPLAGIIASLEDCSDQFCFIAAADFYDLNSEMIAFLYQAYNNEQYLGFEIDKRKQPLCGIYHRNCLPILKEAAKLKHYKIATILESLKSSFISYSISPWRNINHPEDFASIGANHV